MTIIAWLQDLVAHNQVFSGVAGVSLIGGVFYWLRALPARFLKALIWSLSMEVEVSNDSEVFDHLVPRSAGGKMTWTNILTACVDCNAIKANNPANFSGRRGVIAKNGRLRPLKEPKRPTAAELLRAGLEFLPNDVREDFGSFLYWSSELEA